MILNVFTEPSTDAEEKVGSILKIVDSYAEAVVKEAISRAYDEAETTVRKFYGDRGAKLRIYSLKVEGVVDTESTPATSYLITGTVCIPRAS